MCTRVSNRIVSEMANDAAAPVERNLFNNLDADDIVRIFRKATINRDLISTLPPKKERFTCLILVQTHSYGITIKRNFGNCSCVLIAFLFVQL